MRLRRPIYVYGGNLVGGGEHLILNRAKCAASLGLRPAIVTSPGPMDGLYRKVARLIHVDAPLINRLSCTPALARRVAGQVADLLGHEPSHIEATGVPDTYFASLLAEKLPQTDYYLLIIRPGTRLARAWPTLSDLWPSPGRLWQALKGRKDNGVLFALSTSRKILSVNAACANDAARLAGLEHVYADIHPVIVPCHPVGRACCNATGPYLLTVSRLDGGMKSYVEGLIITFGQLAEEYPSLRLLIVGDGPARARLEALANRMGISARVDFLGTQSTGELANLYARAIAFVGMGTAICESAMHGVPSIVALAYNPSAESPGYFGDPSIQGFGEEVEGQPKRPLIDWLRPVLLNPSLGKSIGNRGRILALSENSVEGAIARIEQLLSRPYVGGPPHPWPMPRLKHMSSAFIRGYWFKDQLACEA